MTSLLQKDVHVPCWCHTQLLHPCPEPVFLTISEIWSCLEEAAAIVGLQNLFLHKILVFHTRVQQKSLMLRDMASADMSFPPLIKWISEIYCNRSPKCFVSRSKYLSELDWVVPSKGLSSVRIYKVRLSNRC